MKSFVLILAGTVLGICVLALWSGPFGYAKSGSKYDWNSTPIPYTMKYQGHNLRCLVVEDGSQAGNIGALSCDFDRYKLALLNKSCIPTNTGGGVTQCLQPTVFDTAIVWCIQNHVPDNRFRACVLRRSLR